MKFDPAKAVQTIQDLRERERVAAALLVDLVTLAELGEQPSDRLLADARAYIQARRVRS